MTRIITDTASDLTFAEAKRLDIHLIPLPVYFGNEIYEADINANLSDFYARLAAEKHLPSTSQPAPALYLDIFKEAKENQDDVLVLTISSGLSGTCESVQALADGFGYGCITVVDTTQATLTQRMLVERAAILRKQGMNAVKIADNLNNLRTRFTVCGVLDTLTYLKKGGRIPPALALAGNIFHVKPVLVLRNGKLEPLGKARGLRAGIQKLYDYYEKEAPDPSWPVYFGYTGEREAGEAFMRETVARYGIREAKIYELGGVIGAHLGPGSLLVAFCKQEQAEYAHVRDSQTEGRKLFRKRGLAY